MPIHRMPLGQRRERDLQSHSWKRHLLAESGGQWYGIDEGAAFWDACFGRQEDWDEFVDQAEKTLGVVRFLAMGDGPRQCALPRPFRLVQSSLSLLDLILFQLQQRASKAYLGVLLNCNFACVNVELDSDT